MERPALLRHAWNLEYTGQAGKNQHFHLGSGQFGGEMSRRITVCVTDDDAAVASSLCDGLREFGFDAIEAHSGPEAIEVCTKNDVDLILLDIAMPDMDGFEVCDALKTSPETDDIIVIFVTGKNDPEDVAKGYKMGAADYITKPFNLPMVMVRVESALTNKRVQEEKPLEHEGVLDLAYTDQLTGLKNRRFLMERLAEEADKAKRHNLPLSCLIMDVDDISPVDADSGSISVDDLLAEVAMTLRTYTRTYDVLSRYDGTMFAVLLPHTPLSDATEYASKILNEVDATIYSDPNMPTKASMSVGIVTCGNGGPSDAEEIFGEAMRTLLKAKSMSGERIATCDLKA